MTERSKVGAGAYMEDFGELARLRRAHRNALTAARTADVEEFRRLTAATLKPNGHAQDCVCRVCFEEWRAEQSG